MTSAAWWVTRIPGARPGHPIKTQKEAHKKKAERGRKTGSTSAGRLLLTDRDAKDWFILMKHWATNHQP